MTLQRFFLGVTAVLALSVAGVASASDFPIDMQGTTSSDAGAAETQVVGHNDSGTWSATSSHSDSVPRTTAPATNEPAAPAARAPTTPGAASDEQAETGALAAPPKARSNRWQSLVPGAIK